MHWMEVIATSVATLVMLGAAFKFMWARLDKKFEEIDKKFGDLKNDINERFNNVDENFKTLNERISGMETVIRSIDSRVYRFEGKDEERFRNEIKLMIKERVQQ